LHRSAFTRQRSWSAREFEVLLSQPSTVLTSTRNGFGIIRVIEPEAELLTLAVAPSAQRNGLGTRLVTTLLASAQAFGATETFLEVAADNSAALALYNRAGFTRTGTRPNYYRYPDGGIEDAILLRHTA
jgi:ribosomal-protein-alanine N-acetyltransferase